MKLGLISNEWLEEMIPRLVQQGIKLHKTEEKEESEPQSIKEERKAFLEEKELENQIIRGREASLKKRMRDVEKKEESLRMQIRTFQEKEIELKRRKTVQKNRERRFEQYLLSKKTKMEDIDEIVLVKEESESEKEDDDPFSEKKDVATVPLPDGDENEVDERDERNGNDSEECSLSFCN